MGYVLPSGSRKGLIPQSARGVVLALECNANPLSDRPHDPGEQSPRTHECPYGVQKLFSGGLIPQCRWVEQRGIVFRVVLADSHLAQSSPHRGQECRGHQTHMKAQGHVQVNLLGLKEGVEFLMHERVLVVLF